jgi:hypothetical protein
MTIHDYFKQWCKETARSGSVLSGKSLKEFFDWWEQKQKEIKEQEAQDELYNEKYRT